MVGRSCGCWCAPCFFFFFQAEDGIRDWSVTGVQTCALPISPGCPEATPRRALANRCDAGYSRRRMLLTCRLRCGGGGRWLVQDQPVEPELAHGLHELAEVDRLADVAVGPEAVAVDDVPLLLGRREDDDGQQPGPGVGPDAAQDLHAVDLRQLEVEQDDYGNHRVALVRAGAEDAVERLDSVVRYDDRVLDVVLRQGTPRQRLVVGVVLHQ